MELFKIFHEDKKKKKTLAYLKKSEKTQYKIEKLYDKANKTIALLMEGKDEIEIQPDKYFFKPKNNFVTYTLTGIKLERTGYENKMEDIVIIKAKIAGYSDIFKKIAAITGEDASTFLLAPHSINIDDVNTIIVATFGEYLHEKNKQ
jgi:hypothetical protein